MTASAWFGWVAALAVAIPVAGCKDERAAPPPPVRPVLSVVVTPRAVQVLGFAGTIEPRYRVSLGFRILGRLVARDVEVGDTVRAGKVLAAIDPVSLGLGARSAEAEVFTAQAQLANAAGVEDRTRTLLGQSTATQAQFETAQQAREAAAAGLLRANANLVKAREQLSYANLTSDIDGVVTAIGAQVGQVVSAGQSVVTVARPEIREAVVDVPDEIAREILVDTPFAVALQADATVTAQGRVREIAPQADATTRTRRILISLPDAPDVFRLGTTVDVTLAVRESTTITLPLSALRERDGATQVWVVDAQTRTVALRDVAVERRDAASFRVARGIGAGDRVVTAGVNSLAAGQTVKLVSDAR